MGKILVQWILCLMVFVPLPAFPCGLATPLCIASADAIMAWVTGGLVIATGARIVARQGEAENVEDDVYNNALEVLPAHRYQGGTAGAFMFVLETPIDSDADIDYLNLELEILEIEGKFTRDSDSSNYVSSFHGPYDFKTCNDILLDTCEEGRDNVGDVVYGYTSARVGFMCECVPVH